MSEIVFADTERLVLKNIKYIYITMLNHNNGWNKGKNCRDRLQGTPYIRILFEKSTPHVVITGVATKKIIKREENGNFLAFETVTKKEYITVSKQRKLIEKKLSSSGMYKKVSSENVVRIKILSFSVFTIQHENLW
jgi:hypothetical protein